MTRLAVLSVRDTVADTFGRPFYAPNEASGVRSVRSEVANPQAGPLHEHPDDFQLFHLGWFDDQTAAFELFDHPTLLIRLSHLIDAAVPPAG